MNSEPERELTDVNFRAASGTAEGVGPEFERELTAALRPVRMPAGLSERIAAAVAEKDLRHYPRRGKVVPLPVRQWLGGAAIAAALISGVFAAHDVRQHRKRERQSALATQQFETATRITDQVLEHTRERQSALATQQFETATRITDQVLEHTREQLERVNALRGE